MGKKMMKITTVMIILLIIILVLLFIRYFMNIRSTTKRVPINGSGDFYIEEHIDNKIQDNKGKSGELLEHKNETFESGEAEVELSNEEKNEDKVVTPIETKEPERNISDENKEDNSIVLQENNSQEIQKENVSGDNTEQDVINEDNKIVIEPIISSDTQTSNQDKQQVLSEIDDALQGLLEAVGNVPIVDEEKLNMTLESSEVTP